MPSKIFDSSVDNTLNDAIPKYRPFCQVEDTRPIRATCFHPDGEVFVVGTNSRLIHICMYPTREELEQARDDHLVTEPDYAFRFVHLHRSSVYCTAFNSEGNLLASGSNDQSVHVIEYNSQKHLPEGKEYKLTIHSGTVRDICFLKNGNESESSAFLVSAGAGDNAIYLTDCKTMKTVQNLHGHESTVMSLHQWNDAPTFVSGGFDGAIRFWDTRAGTRCTSKISTTHLGGDEKSNQSTPVGVVRVDQTGKFLVSGHKDGRCMFYDVRSGRIMKLFKAHDDEIRTLNFSPKSYYLLTAGYDHKVKLMDLQGDLTRNLPTVEVAELSDKVIQTTWHPSDYTFVTTSAEGSAILWVVPEVISSI